MPETKLYVDVIVPLAVEGLFTYSVPERMQIAISPGSRVIVQFGRRKRYSAIVTRVHDNAPQDYAVKAVEELLDTNPLVNAAQLNLWQWIADYYLCTPGDVMKAALPAGLRLESETLLVLIKEGGLAEGLSDAEILLYNALSDGKAIHPDQIKWPTGSPGLLSVANKLAAKGLLGLHEGLHSHYKPKLVTWITSPIGTDGAEKLLPGLKRSAKQQEALQVYLKLTGIASRQNQSGVQKAALLAAGASHAALSALEKKGILLAEEHEEARYKQFTEEINASKGLNPAQEKALSAIRALFESRPVVLLHGVTSSGKTEIYIHFIEEVIGQGKQVLYLLPEIALTTQIVKRLRAVFGNKVGVYHSKYSENERTEVWYNLSGSVKPGAEPFQVILGARSALFLPFTKLGLVIIDEEHENSFKQYDPAPRYHARDTAIMLASLYKASVLLGTATPAFESYHNALQGKYGLVELNERYLDLEMPEIVVANSRKARKKKQMRSMFTPELLQAMEEALGKGEQVILFQNRRGFAPYLECEACHHIPICQYCDVSLTYHKNGNNLTCHYCGFTKPVPRTCPDCKDGAFVTRGFGTEKVEDEIGLLFPEAKVVRLDLDSSRSRKAYENIISSFSQKEFDILVGTQMVSKGLDFEHVSVVGILDADQMLRFPDFRSYERSLQLIMQVSGRAGRKHGRGKVVIQASDPENPVITFACKHDYKGFFHYFIEERRQFLYPPFIRLLAITLRHKQENLAARAAVMLGEKLQSLFPGFVLGPEVPLVGRISDYHLKRFLLKLPRNSRLQEGKKELKPLVKKLLEQQGFSGLQVSFDVDPL